MRVLAVTTRSITDDMRKRALDAQSELREARNATRTAEEKIDSLKYGMSRLVVRLDCQWCERRRHARLGHTDQSRCYLYCTVCEGVRR